MSFYFLFFCECCQEKSLNRSEEFEEKIWLNVAKSAADAGVDVDVGCCCCCWWWCWCWCCCRCCLRVVVVAILRISGCCLSLAVDPIVGVVLAVGDVAVPSVVMLLLTLLPLSSFYC